MQPYDTTGNYIAQTAQSDAIPETAILKIAERSKRYIGVRGNNPTEQVLLVAVVPKDTTITAAEIRAGRWTYRVEPGQFWDDAGANVEYHFVTEGVQTSAVTHYIQEVL